MKIKMYLGKISNVWSQFYSFFSLPNIYIYIYSIVSFMDHGTHFFFLLYELCLTVLSKNLTYAYQI